MAPVTVPIIKKEYDYLVIGGGSGGIASARRAAGMYGAKTVLVESKRLGGTCVNVGCVPKKVTWNAAAIAETLKDARSYGFNFKETAPFDWTTFKHKRDAYVKRLNGIYERNLSNDGVEYIHGRAHLLSQREVEIDLDDGGKDYIRAKKILIATGGHPNLPKDIPGSEYGITSDGFFDLETQPQKVAIIGAGYIAVEFAGMFHALGTETHLFIRHDTFLRNFDPMIQETITKEYENMGIKLYKGSTQSKVEKDEDAAGSNRLKLHYTSSNRGSGVLEDIDTLVWAIGRSAEVEDLGLENAGVAQKPEKGLIQANEYQETNVGNIYALGDVCGLVELTPVAIAAGRRLSDRLFGPAEHARAKLDYTNVPSVVFAHPEVGSIGLTEPQARREFGDENVKVYQTRFTGMYYALMPPEDKKPSVYKLIVQGKDETVVGLHILGQGCSEILQGFGVAIKMGAKKRDFDSCVAIHPTSAEELVTMK